MVQIWSSVSKIGQNRHIEIAFLKLNWGQFRILSTVWSHLKREFNYKSKVIWLRSSEVRGHVTEDHVIKKRTYRCFILAIGGLRMIHIGFIVIKHIVWLIEYARLKYKNYFEVKQGQIWVKNGPKLSKGNQLWSSGQKLFQESLGVSKSQIMAQSSYWVNRGRMKTQRSFLAKKIK